MSRRAPGPHDSRQARDASLRAAIAGLPEARISDRQDAIRVQIDFLSGAYGIPLEAARVRRLSLPAYARRATLAMACYDLGIPLSDALERDDRMSRPSGFGVADPTGLLFGSWEIERLVSTDEHGSGTPG